MAFAQPLFFCCLLASCLIAICHAADPTFYSIWPLDSLNDDNNKAVTSALQSDLNNDATKLYVSTSDSLSATWYWYAELTDDLVTKYQSFTGVRKVIVPNNGPQAFRALPVRRDDAPFNVDEFTVDPAAPDQLKILSLPAGKSLSDAKGYVFDQHAGEGINVYVIDSGLNPNSPEFAGRQVSWLFAGPFAAQDMSDSDIGQPGADPTEKGHGTCMASIAMGNKDGVTRKSTLTVVRSDIFSNNNADLAAEIWIDAMAKVHEDVIQKNLQSKAVVSMSFGLPANSDADYTSCFSGAMASILTALDKLDIPAAAAVANEGTEINDFPALLIKAVNGVVPVPNLIVVSGALTDGDFDSDIRDPEIKIYGPSDDQAGGSIRNPGLECASLEADGNGYHRGESGVSHATAAVAGMVAYWMSVGNTGAQARQALFDDAVVHINNGPPMPNNDVDGTNP